MAKAKSDKSKYPGTESQIHVDSTTQPYLPEGSPNIGHFASVVKGEHKGRYGVVERVASFGSDGWPKTVAFRTRDDDSEMLTVKYDDLEADRAGKR